MNIPSSRRPKEYPQGERRTKYERWAEILEACVWEARTQSWLMRELGLKTKSIKEDVGFLVKAGLIEQLDAPDVGIYVYKTTEKGRKVLDKFYQMISGFFSST